MSEIQSAGGDAVAWTEEGVSVNGKMLPASAPLEADKAGRTMLRYQFQ